MIEFMSGPVLFVAMSDNLTRDYDRWVRVWRNRRVAAMGGNGVRHLKPDKF